MKTSITTGRVADSSTTIPSGSSGYSRPPLTKEQRNFNIARKMDDNRGRGFEFLWEIWPDYWKNTWGQKPLLGTVRADSEFDAMRAAYDYKLLPYNFTFGPLAIKVDSTQPKRKVQHGRYSR